MACTAERMQISSFHSNRNESFGSAAVSVSVALDLRGHPNVNFFSHCMSKTHTHTHTDKMESILVDLHLIFSAVGVVLHSDSGSKSKSEDQVKINTKSSHPSVDNDFRTKFGGAAVTAVRVMWRLQNESASWSVP